MRSWRRLGWSPHYRNPIGLAQAAPTASPAAPLRPALLAVLPRSVATPARRYCNVFDSCSMTSSMSSNPRTLSPALAGSTSGRWSITSSQGPARSAR